MVLQDPLEELAWFVALYLKGCEKCSFSQQHKVPPHFANLLSFAFKRNWWGLIASATIENLRPKCKQIFSWQFIPGAAAADKESWACWNCSVNSARKTGRRNKQEKSWSGKIGQSTVQENERKDGSFGGKKGDRPPFDPSYYFESTNILKLNVKLEFLFLEPFVLLCLWNRRGSANMMNITVYSQSCFPPNFHPDPWHVVLNVCKCTSIFFSFLEGGGGTLNHRWCTQDCPNAHQGGNPEVDNDHYYCSIFQIWELVLHTLLLPECQSTDNSLLQEPKIYTLYVLLGQRGRNCVKCPWCEGLFGGSANLLGSACWLFSLSLPPSLGHQCHPRWATEQKIEASPINEDASLSAYLPRCMGGHQHSICNGHK